jgi:phosphatidate phosphatase LPIN
LISALLREVWTKNPEEFKIDCLSGIANLFPESSAPFIAGFGNKTNDEKAYRTVLIPDKRIFTIDKKGVVKSSDSTLSNFSTSYERLEQVVDFFFPPICRSSSSTSLRHLSNTFWRLDLPDIDFDSELAEP